MEGERKGRRDVGERGREKIGQSGSGNTRHRRCLCGRVHRPRNSSFASTTSCCSPAALCAADGRDGTEEMMQPCLIRLHAVSLVASPDKDGTQRDDATLSNPPASHHLFGCALWLRAPVGGRRRRPARPPEAAGPRRLQLAGGKTAVKRQWRGSGTAVERQWNGSEHAATGSGKAVERQ